LFDAIAECISHGSNTMKYPNLAFNHIAFVGYSPEMNNDNPPRDPCKTGKVGYYFGYSDTNPNIDILKTKRCIYQRY